MISERLIVMSTVYPLADLVRQVGGRWVDSQWVLERGQTLHGFIPNDDLRARLNVAGLIVTGGGADESWAVEGYEGQYRSARLIRLDALDVTLKPPPGADAADLLPPQTVTGHLWLDPGTARKAAGPIAARLSPLRPRGENEFRDNARALEQQIDAVVAESAPRLAAARGRKVMVLTSAYDALLQRFGIEPVHIVDHPSPLRLTDAQISRLRSTAANPAEHVHYLLLEADVPPAVVDDVARRIGVKVLLINSLGTSAAIGPSTYQALLRYNLNQLTQIK